MNDNGQAKQSKSRRDFLKKASKAAVVAPAAGLILSATHIPASGIAPSGRIIDICQENPNSCL